MPEAPSTGYIWTTDSSIVADLTQQQPRHEANNHTEPEWELFDHDEIDRDESDLAVTLPIALVSNEFEANEFRDEEMRYGGGGNRYLTFRTLMPGDYTLRLTNRRPWQSAAPPAEVFEVHLTVSPRPTGDSENGLSLYQQSLMSGA